MSTPCVLENGYVRVGDTLTAQVDKEYRWAIARNHTATHLLQAALREVLGDHVHQAGSYQDAHVTHFDFTHFSAVTPEELAKVEQIVNDKIFDALEVKVQSMALDEAKKMAPWPSSAKSTAKSSGWWTSAAGPPSSAAAPMSGTPPRSAASRSSASRRSRPASAASRPSPARTC